MTDIKPPEESDNSDSQIETDKDIQPDYPPPVNKLLTLADARELVQMPDFYGMGLRKKHAPDLIRMAIDTDLYDGDRETLAAWAPIHAWRALAMLDITEAIEPLIEGVFWWADEGDEWVINEMPLVFEHFGPMAIPALVEFLKPHQLNGITPRILAILCLRTIGLSYIGMAQGVANIFFRLLRDHHQDYHPLVNSILAVQVETIKPSETSDTVETLINKLLETEEIIPDVLFTGMAIVISEEVFSDEDDIDTDFFEAESPDLKLLSKKPVRRDKKKKRKQVAKSRRVNRKKKRRK